MLLLVLCYYKSSTHLGQFFFTVVKILQQTRKVPQEGSAQMMMKRMIPQKQRPTSKMETMRMGELVDILKHF